MAQSCFVGLFCVIVVQLTVDISTSNPVPDSDQTLVMQLTVESGSGTAVPVEGGKVTFRCDIQDYEKNAHVVTWTRFDSTSATWDVLVGGGNLKDPADPRVLISRVQASDVSRQGNVHQRLVIEPVRNVDNGLYRCNVETTVDRNTTGCVTKTIASREQALAVYTAETFPVCTPSAKSLDPLVPGNTLACGTLTKVRIPVVTKRGNEAGEPEAWTKGPRRDGRPGWELTRKVNSTDDGTVYDCWSVPIDIAAGELALSCPIAPRVVGGTELPPAQELSVGAIIGIAVGVFVLVVVVLVVFCCCCCCRGS